MMAKTGINWVLTYADMAGLHVNHVNHRTCPHVTVHVLWVACAGSLVLAVVAVLALVSSLP